MESKVGAVDKSLVTLNQTVGDRYRLQSVLGRGGFGTVFCALQAPLDRPVALKVCHARTDDRRALARFEREARIIAKLRSPHTVRLYDFGLTEDNHPYFAMEMINGRSLAEELTLGALTPIRIAQARSASPWRKHMPITCFTSI